MGQLRSWASFVPEPRSLPVKQRSRSWISTHGVDSLTVTKRDLAGNRPERGFLLSCFAHRPVCPAPSQHISARREIVAGDQLFSSVLHGLTACSCSGGPHVSSPCSSSLPRPLAAHDARRRRQPWSAGEFTRALSCAPCLVYCSWKSSSARRQRWSV
jgi:hypothetical protein